MIVAQEIKKYIEKTLGQYISNNIYFHNETNCWQWKGRSLENHYHPIYNNTGFSIPRLFYQRFYGDIPNGFEVGNTCKLSGCLNPFHMKLKKVY